MISFASDYTTGAAPEILKRLADTNMEPLSGYGTDRYSESAACKIKEATGLDDAEVFFISGGTQTNQLIIDTMLEPYEGVVAAVTGHVAAHEAGAIEYTGHKVLCIDGHEGVMYANELREFLKNFYSDGNHEHMVFPGMVYISFPTEYGTLYSKEELREIYDICREYDMPLFVDGARLGYGLASHKCDLTLKELARLCDVFYIGGTKVGALCGEAVVFTHKNAPSHFVTRIKQHGALLAKGRLLGIQFDTLFTNDLYFELSRHAITAADRLKGIFKSKKYRFFIDSPTNQQFVVLSNDLITELSDKVTFSFWERYDENHSVVRFATSWSTTDEELEYLESILPENRE